MEFWYAVHAKPHKERQVAEQLRLHRLEVFLPLARVSATKPWAAPEQPFFPGYLFVKADLEKVGFGEIQWTPGVRRFVEFGGQRAIVPDHFMIELKRRMSHIRAAGGLLFDGLAQGDTVKITGGPFAGREAIFDVQLSGTERVRVMLEWIEQSQHHHPRSRSAAKSGANQPRLVPVELNANSIERIRRKG